MNSFKRDKKEEEDGEYINATFDPKISLKTPRR